MPSNLRPALGGTSGEEYAMMYFAIWRSCGDKSHEGRLRNANHESQNSMKICGGARRCLVVFMEVGTTVVY